jgi:hypothetical protein
VLCTRRHSSASGRPGASLIERGALRKSALVDGRAAARASRRAAALVAGAYWRHKGLDALASAVRAGSFRGGAGARMSRFRCWLSCWTTWRRRVRRWFRENVSAAVASTPGLCRSLMLDACGFWTLVGGTVAGADPSPMIGLNSLAHQVECVVG